MELKEKFLEAIEQSHYRVSDFINEVFPHEEKPIDDDLARCNEWNQIESMHGMRRMRDVS